MVLKLYAYCMLRVILIVSSDIFCYRSAFCGLLSPFRMQHKAARRIKNEKSYYELYGYTEREGRFAALQAYRQAIIEPMQRSHEENQRTLEAVQRAFEVVGIPYDCLYRGELGAGDAAGSDL